MGGTPTEPSADLRQAASSMWQMYVALTNEGFSENQALKIIGSVIAAQTGNADG
jgi:hypothetical protein